MDFVTMCLMVLFGASGAFGMIANLVITVHMRVRGLPIPWHLGGVAAAAYIQLAPERQERRWLLLARAVGWAIVVILVSGVVLYFRVVS